MLHKSRLSHFGREYEPWNLDSEFEGLVYYVSCVYILVLMVVYMQKLQQDVNTLICLVTETGVTSTYVQNPRHCHKT